MIPISLVRIIENESRSKFYGDWQGYLEQDILLHSSYQ